MKIVINRCYGGWHLSEAQKELLKAEHQYSQEDEHRTHPQLIASVEAGDQGGHFAELTVVEIPDGVHYKVFEYDGYEYIIWSESPINEV